MTTPTTPQLPNLATGTAAVASGSADTSPASHASAATAFADYLARLVQNEQRAALAALRRGLGRRPELATDMFPYIVPWLTDAMSSARQADYFLVAALFASHQISWSRPAAESDVAAATDPAGSTGSAGAEGSIRGYSNLGASFHQLTAATGSESVEKRFVALLNAEREDLPLHLRHAVSLLRAHDIPVDWARLLTDLASWDREDRRVQSAWARAFWRHESASSIAAHTESEATALHDN